MLIYLVVILVVSGTGFAPNAYGDQAQGGVMSSRPLAFPDDCPYYHYLRCNNFSSSSSASVVMPFDVDATRGCCSMGNDNLRRAQCYKLFFYLFSDHGLQTLT